MNKIKIVRIKNLKPHEKTNKLRLAEVKALIKKSKLFIEPIIIDGKHFIILDGHHRTRVLTELGYKNIPALVVDYSNPRIKVLSRRSNLPVSKKLIIDYALAGKTFPHKTSKHIIPSCPRNLNIKLAELL